MFENLCTLPLSSELFTQALHPIESVLAVGLSAGHVQCFRLPAVPGSSSDDDDPDTSIVSTGTSTIDTEWRTRRHKGSCRTLAYSGDGEILYSAGTDGFLKAATSSTGQVVSKLAIPLDRSTNGIDPPTLLHPLSPQTLLLATDSAALHLYDLRVPSELSAKPSQTHRPHDDYISSLTPLPPTEASTSGFSKQWVTTGGTTLAVTDLRRGVLVKSENQEEELLSSIFVGGLPARPGRSKGQKILVGSSNGVLTLWERGVWDDQDERIIVDGGRGGGESLDSLVVMPEEVGDGGKNVVVGLGDGSIRIVKLGPNKLVGELRHDEVEAVVGLGFDVGGRLISGGGSIVKVWQEKLNIESDEEDDSEEEEAGAQKRAVEGSDSDGSDAADSSDEDSGRKRRKKRRKARKGNNSGNGILGFKGLE
ncbi:WD domain-containing protein [Mollisia scopiformis]|uniref:WD repeat-containing protein JIP5 n=1 Tax=Mollisia scopiformis TaxID=149040 RepID=A0A132BC54_MOLSC|nr:WD domain-containing protein [Mollisia scopiformis]KUJ09589.1 WD domain-containing protein [Mollisia scopiformis]